MKSLFIIVILASLFGCGGDDKSKPLIFTALPPELADCKAFFIENQAGYRMIIMRCPNSTTTVQTIEKSPKTTIVVDGIEYEAKK